MRPCVAPRPKWRIALAQAVAATLILLALAPAAGAAKRTVPVGFWGTNWDGAIKFDSPDETREANWKMMAESGVEAARTTFLWSQAQPLEFYPVDFTVTDAVVRLAVTNGIRLLPVVAAAPRWARQSDEKNSPPTNRGRGAYANFIRELINRYGQEGSFWEEYSSLPKRPIGSFQIWNEPSANYQWTIPEDKDWAPGYGALLRKSYNVIKAADPDAKVVLAGLPNRSYQDLEHLYKAGNIHGAFDVAALHPYTAHEHGVLTITERFRQVMTKYGDGKKELWITELGLPASKGKSNDPSTLQTTNSGMAKFLEQSYSDLMKNRKRLRVPKAYWYTWASSYKGWIFNFTGLNRWSEGTESPKPALKVYRKMARRAQGR
jgi:polysaccharide biosynthesis protein PslG